MQPRPRAGRIRAARGLTPRGSYNAVSMHVFCETRLKVRYAETDLMGVVYYANYLVWMEVGRVALCRQLGFSYRDMEDRDGVLLAVAEAKCRYRNSARFDDEVIVKTWLERADPRMAVFGYEMRLAEGGAILAEGSTTHLFVNREMKRARLPEKYFPMFGLR